MSETNTTRTFDVMLIGGPFDGQQLVMSATPPVKTTVWLLDHRGSEHGYRLAGIGLFGPLAAARYEHIGARYEYAGARIVVSDGTPAADRE